jgi:hypothetical protein
MALRARRQHQLIERNRDFALRLWDSSRPSPPRRPVSAAGRMYSPEAAKLIPDHKRSAVSPLGGLAGDWWSGGPKR